MTTEDFASFSDTAIMFAGIVYVLALARARGRVGGRADRARAVGASRTARPSRSAWAPTRAGSTYRRGSGAELAAAGATATTAASCASRPPAGSASR